MSFKCHISVLKSLLSFKAGLDISGHLDNLRFRIAQAKCKDVFMPSHRTGIDIGQLNLGNKIRNVWDGIK